MRWPHRLQLLRHRPCPVSPDLRGRSDKVLRPFFLQLYILNPHRVVKTEVSKDDFSGNLQLCPHDVVPDCCPPFNSCAQDQSGRLIVVKRREGRQGFLCDSHEVDCGRERIAWGVVLGQRRKNPRPCLPWHAARYVRLLTDAHGLLCTPDCASFVICTATKSDQKRTSRRLFLAINLVFLQSPFAA